VVLRRGDQLLTPPARHGGAAPRSSRFFRGLGVLLHRKLLLFVVRHRAMQQQCDDGQQRRTTARSIISLDSEIHPSPQTAVVQQSANN
jgi:hypothetical protein